MSERALVVRSAGVGSDVSNVHWNVEWFGQQRPTFLYSAGRNSNEYRTVSVHYRTG